MNFGVVCSSLKVFHLFGVMNPNRLNGGQERWCGGSGEDSTIARRLRGGLGDGTGSREVDNGACSREIFGGKIWQPDGVSEASGD
jgi:hypothetical protein